jgi:hypothetical protein
MRPLELLDLAQCDEPARAPHAFDFGTAPSPPRDGNARLERAFGEIRELYAKANTFNEGGIQRSLADEVAADAYELIWSAVHGGDFAPVFCACGRRPIPRGATGDGTK